MSKQKMCRCAILLYLGHIGFDSRLLNRFLCGLSSDSPFLLHKIIDVSYNSDYTAAAVIYALEMLDSTDGDDCEYIDDDSSAEWFGF